MSDLDNHNTQINDCELYIDSSKVAQAKERIIKELEQQLHIRDKKISILKDALDKIYDFNIPNIDVIIEEVLNQISEMEGK